MFKFEQIEHTADLGLLVKGDTLAELFRAAWEGWRMLVGPSGYLPENLPVEFKLKAEEPEMLLVEFLSEINFRFFVKQRLVEKIKELNVFQKGGIWQLQAECFFAVPGDFPDFTNEIKAVTFHQLKIEQKEGWYQTRIFFDV
ncbi:MAG: archease [Calditrichia bacterium]